MSKIQSVRGMNDLLPTDSVLWQKIETVIYEILESFGYKEIRFPIVENTALFKRAIGEVTDIVEKEMYTFDDRNGDSLTLRPEGTASCVRACEQHGMLHNQTQKLWYSGPMFRHERPQKGRLRQFHQIGVEAFGFSGPDIDCEMLMLTAKLWRELGIEKNVELQINSLGSKEARIKYRNVLVEYLNDFIDELDADSVRRISSNPLRIFDSKVEHTQAILRGAPVLHDYLDDVSRSEFLKISSTLDKLGIPFKCNSGLVRGLDYYNGLVFEWVTSDLGSQGTICAGGRYDGLVSQLGGKSTPAFGFALGMERLVLLVSAILGKPEDAESDIYFVVEEAAYPDSLVLADACRDQLPGLIIQTHCGGGVFKTQFKRADKSGARIAVVIGENELADREATVKFLREERQQERVAFDRLPSYLKDSFF